MVSLQKRSICGDGIPSTKLNYQPSIVFTKGRTAVRPYQNVSRNWNNPDGVALIYEYERRGKLDACPAQAPG